MHSIQRKIIFLVIFTVVSIVYFELNFLDEPSSYAPKLTCGRLPEEEDILIDNLIWQIVQIQDRIYKLYNAYFDDRENKTVVRVGVLGERLNNVSDVIFCQFWFDETSDALPIVVRATQYIKMWPECE